MKSKRDFFLWNLRSFFNRNGYSSQSDCIYPCFILSWTHIKQWFNLPLSHARFLQVTLYFLSSRIATAFLGVLQTIQQWDCEQLLPTHPLTSKICYFVWELIFVDDVFDKTTRKEFSSSQVLKCLGKLRSRCLPSKGLEGGGQWWRWLRRTWPDRHSCCWSYW